MSAVNRWFFSLVSFTGAPDCSKRRHGYVVTPEATSHTTDASSTKPSPHARHVIPTNYIMRLVFHHTRTSTFWTQKSVCVTRGRYDVRNHKTSHRFVWGYMLGKVRRDSSVGIATRYGWAVRGSNPSAGEIFSTCPDRLWGPPRLLYNGYRVFTAGKERPGRGVDQ